MNAPTPSQLFKWCAASAFALGVVLSSTRAPALDVPVLLGDVGVGKESPQVRTLLRAMLNKELAKTDFAQVKTHDHFVLSAMLVRLDSVAATDSDSVRATCVVSVALLRDNGATLHAVIRGRATAEESKAHAAAAQSDALRAAVHSAITRAASLTLKRDARLTLRLFYYDASRSADSSVTPALRSNQADDRLALAMERARPTRADASHGAKK